MKVNNDLHSVYEGTKDPLYVLSIKQDKLLAKTWMNQEIV